MNKTRILLVCMGNICRSPTAEGVLRARLEEAGLSHAVELDSAGTHDYNIGAPPDARARQAAARRGVDLSALRARRVDASDFARFDLILAMDRGNLAWLRAACPPEHHGKLGLFLGYSGRFDGDEVSDPYYGGPEGFERVLDMIEDAADGLIAGLDAK